MQHVSSCITLASSCHTTLRACNLLASTYRQVLKMLQWPLVTPFSTLNTPSTSKSMIFAFTSEMWTIGVILLQKTVNQRKILHNSQSRRMNNFGQPPFPKINTPRKKWCSCHLRASGGALQAPPPRISEMVYLELSHADKIFPEKTSSYLQFKFPKILFLSTLLLLLSPLSEGVEKTKPDFSSPQSRIHARFCSNFVPKQF